MTFEAAFAFGDRVCIDGDAGISAVVVGFCFYERGHNIQVAWFNNGKAESSWVEHYRLSKDVARRPNPWLARED